MYLHLHTFSYTHVKICIHTTYVAAHTHAHTHTRAHTHTHTNTYIHTHTQTHTHVHTHVRKATCVTVSMYIHVYPIKLFSTYVTQHEKTRLMWFTIYFDLYFLQFYYVIYQGSEPRVSPFFTSKFKATFKVRRQTSTYVKLKVLISNMAWVLNEWKRLCIAWTVASHPASWPTQSWRLPAASKISY